MRTTIVVAITSLALALPASAQQSESGAATINVAVESAGAASDAHPATDQPALTEIKGPRSLMGMVMAALIDSAERQAQQRALPVRARESARAAPPPAAGELLEEEPVEESARVALQPTP